MEIRDFQFNMFAVNTYILWDPASGDGAIVDPGMISSHDNQAVSSFISDNRISLKYLLNTHLHIDHTLGNDYIESHYGLKAFANSNDEFLGERRAEQARMFGLSLPRLTPVEIGRNLTDGKKILLGKEEIIVLQVPGHSPGSVAFYVPSSQFVITGDALFEGSIGRTDLPGGNQRELISSVKSKLLSLPPNTVVYPGHGPATTIGYEKMHNPFL